MAPQPAALWGRGEHLPAGPADPCPSQGGLWASSSCLVTQLPSPQHLPLAPHGEFQHPSTQSDRVLSLHPLPRSWHWSPSVFPFITAMKVAWSK